MPVKNTDVEGLNTYKFYFSDGSSESFHTKDKLIQRTAKGDWHPIVFAGDEWLAILSNVLYIQNVTPVEKK